MYFQYAYNINFGLTPYIFCWQPKQGAPTTKVAQNIQVTPSIEVAPSTYVSALNTEVPANAAPVANEVPATIVAAAKEVPPKKKLLKAKRGGEVSEVQSDVPLP